MNNELKWKLASFFSASELVELLDLDTYDLISALEAFEGADLFTDGVLEELEEIVDG